MNSCDIAVIGELVDMFGADVRRHINKPAVTKWASGPLFRGGYSAARPGDAHRRADLAAPLDGKPFFAGEACSIEAYATCHGAYVTEGAAANAAAAALQAGAPSLWRGRSSAVSNQAMRRDEKM